MDTGIEVFKLLLKEYRNLAVWAVGGSLAIPIVAQLVSVVPPWPNGVAVITGIFQLLVLALIFQMFFGRAKRLISRNMLFFTVSAFVFLLLYLMAWTFLVIPEGDGHPSFVRGLKCTSDALLVFADGCPFLSSEDLATNEYKIEDLWTIGSIAASRLLLLSVWFSFYLSTSAALAFFLTHQIRARR